MFRNHACTAPGPRSCGEAAFTVLGNHLVFERPGAGARRARLGLFGPSTSASRMGRRLSSSSGQQAAAVGDQPLAASDATRDIRM
jgi:hypothetical protein